MEACPPSSWLDAGDIFDEESCRYFLREVGEQVVPFCPFLMGIHEVYSILLEKYGKDYVADALSVLKELMESEDNANGLGDDGDIWRSWRHDWRHRHDDKQNPLIPQVRGCILPPPTPREERVAKAHNFSAWSAACQWRFSENESKETSYEGEQTLPGISMNAEALPSPIRDHSSELHMTDPRLLPSNVPSRHNIAAAIDELLARQSPTLRAESEARLLKAFEECKSMEHRSLLNLSTNGLGLDTERHSTDSTTRAGREQQSDSEQEFDEIKEWAQAIDFHKSELVCFDMLQPSQVLQDRDINIGSPQRRTLRAVRSPDGTETSPDSHDQDADIAFETRTNTGSGRIRVIKTENSWDIDNLPSHSVDRDLTTYSNSLKQAQVSASLKRRTSTNRDARLIDGAIFTPKLRDLVELPGPGEVHAISKLDSKRSSLRASWSGVRQKENLRHSWYQGVRSLFQNKQSPARTREPDYNNEDARSDNCEMTLSHRSGIPEPSIESVVQNSCNHNLGLDGTFDQPSHLPNSPIKLNKALPQMPKVQNPNKLPPMHTRSSSFDHSQATTDRPSTASTASSDISIVSSKRDFRRLARALLDEDDAGSHPELSPVREAEALGNSEGTSQKSARSEYSIMNCNPFTEDHVLLTPKPPLPLSLRKREPQKAIETSSLPQSRSEPSFQPYVLRKAVNPKPAFPASSQTMEKPKQTHTAKTVGYPIQSNPVRHSPRRSEGGEGVTVNTRGRKPERPLSPTGTANKAYSYSKPWPEEKTLKRSASPVKKLFDFVKSPSGKDLNSETLGQSDNVSPENRKIKNWGSRLRHGFLHMDVQGEPGPEVEIKASPEGISEQSPPVQSMFPVSLAPTYQAKVLSEIELVICVCCNRFLMHEFSAGRLSDISVTRVKQQWAKKNRPQVIEFFYDQATQRDLVMANLNSIHLHGESSKNALVLNATMYAWKTMATEMIVRTFCTPDSVIRKYMHDTHKILETLGAPLQTFLAFQDLQVKTLGMINEKQRERLERSKERQKQFPALNQTPTRIARVPTPAAAAAVFGYVRKASKEATIESSPSPGFEAAYEEYEKSRGGRLGMMVRELSEGRSP